MRPQLSVTAGKEAKKKTTPILYTSNTHTAHWPTKITWGIEYHGIDSRLCTLRGFNPLLRNLCKPSNLVATTYWPKKQQTTL